MNFQTDYFSRAKLSLAAAIVIPLLLCVGGLLAWQTIAPNAAFAQETSGITSPAAGSAVTETVTISGTATDPNFQSYVLHYKPSDGFEYAYFDDGSQPVIDGELGVWDTSDLAAGSYDLRLRVVRTDGNYDEYLVENLQVGVAAQSPEEEATEVVTVTVAITPTATVTSTSVVTEATPSATSPVTEEVEPVATLAVTATSTPEATEIPPTVAPTPEGDEAADLPTDAAQLVTDRNINVRGGPGTDYPIVAALQTGDSALIIGQNEAGDWWQIQLDGAQGWVLGSIVTATNVDDVPIVAAPPTPTATPVTPTATPSTADATATGEAVETVVAEEEIVETTVSLDGNTGDVAGLALFLRTLLAGFSADESTITATVGAVPAGLPIELEIPTSATVIGGVTRSDGFAGNQLFLSAASGAENLVEILRGQLITDGFGVPSQEAQRGPSEVFISSGPMGAPVVLCGPDNDTVVVLTTLRLSGEDEIVGVNTNTGGAIGGPCGEEPTAPGSGAFDVLPSLTPPSQAVVRGRGTGSSSGTDGFSISAEAEIETAQSVSALADHYETQLEEAGWERASDSATEDLSWSAWTFSSDDTEWSATFYIVRRGSEDGAFLATLHAATE